MVAEASSPAGGGASARYDAVADFYLAEIGGSVDDPATAALLALVGPVRGLDVLDVACGQGRVSRALAARGARVTGVDLAGELVAKARQAERREPLGVTYLVGDICAAGDVLAPASYDRVVCNFGLSDIDDLAGALGTVAAVLRPGGRFVFSILHPCFPGWGTDASASWRPGWGYFHEGWWRAQGRASRLRAAVGANHRMLSTYLNQLTERGLVVDRTDEPAPPPAWLAAAPGADAVPTFLVLRCRQSALPRPLPAPAG